MRTNSVVHTGTTGAIDGNYTIKWRHDRLLMLDVHYMKLTNMYDNGEDEGLKKEASSPAKRKKLRRKVSVAERTADTDIAAGYNDA